MTSDETPATSVGKHLGPPPGEFVPVVQIGVPRPWPDTQFLGCVLRVGDRELVSTGTTPEEAIAGAIRSLGDILEHRPAWLTGRD